MKRDIESKLNAMECQVREMEAIVKKMKDKKYELDLQKGMLVSLKNLLR